jgi:hypothetical protein
MYASKQRAAQGDPRADRFFRENERRERDMHKDGEPHSAEIGEIRATPSEAQAHR